MPGPGKAGLFVGNGTSNSGYVTDMVTVISVGNCFEGLEFSEYVLADIPTACACGLACENPSVHYVKFLQKGYSSAPKIAVVSFLELTGSCSMAGG